MFGLLFGIHKKNGRKESGTVTVAHFKTWDCDSFQDTVPVPCWAMFGTVVLAEFLAKIRIWWIWLWLDFCYKYDNDEKPKISNVSWAVKIVPSYSLKLKFRTPINHLNFTNFIPSIFVFVYRGSVLFYWPQESFWLSVKISRLRW